MTTPRDTDPVNDHLIVGGVIGGDLNDPVDQGNLPSGTVETDTRAAVPVPDYDRDPPTSPIPAQRAPAEKKGFFSRLFNRD